MQQQSPVACRDVPFKSVVQISCGEKRRPAKNCDGSSTHVVDNSSSVPAKWYILKKNVNVSDFLILLLTWSV
jgi:hypothetical protein